MSGTTGKVIRYVKPAVFVCGILVGIPTGNSYKNLLPSATQTNFQPEKPKLKCSKMKERAQIALVQSEF